MTEREYLADCLASDQYAFNMWKGKSTGHYYSCLPKCLTFFTDESLVSLFQVAKGWSDEDRATLSQIMDRPDLIVDLVPEGDPDNDYGWFHRSFPSLSEQAASLRRGLNSQCPECRDGHARTLVVVGQHKVEMQPKEVLHPDCTEDVDDLMSRISRLLPQGFQHDLADLKPWPKSPVPVDRQQAVIHKIPSRLPDKLRGWLMVGPAGTGKSTFALAAAKDWVTWRLQYDIHLTRDRGDNVRNISVRSLAPYFVSIPEWLDEMQAWETRDFANKSTVPPSITPKIIAKNQHDTGWRPILLLDEVDKFTPTENRRNLLFRLVDAVYKANGIIVTTANTPLADLRKMLGDPIYRRIAGTNDAEGAYMVMDFFRAASPARPDQP